MRTRTTFASPLIRTTSRSPSARTRARVRAERTVSLPIAARDERAVWPSTLAAGAAGAAGVVDAAAGAVAAAGAGAVTTGAERAVPVPVRAMLRIVAPSSEIASRALWSRAADGE